MAEGDVLLNTVMEIKGKIGSMESKIGSMETEIKRGTQQFREHIISDKDRFDKVDQGIAGLVLNQEIAKAFGQKAGSSAGAKWGVGVSAVIGVLVEVGRRVMAAG